MKKFSYYLILSVICCLIISENLHAARRLLYENFDDKSLNDTSLKADEGGSGRDLVEGDDYEWAEGRNGSGYCIYFRKGDAGGDATLIWSGIGEWPSNELYFSYWVRFPEFKQTATHENIKMFYPHWNGAQSYTAYSLVNSGTLYHSVKGDGQMLASGKWVGAPNMTDGKWHHYEFYINFSEGINRFWYDGKLKVDEKFGTGAWSNKNIYYIAAPSIDALSVSDFSRQIDDWEVWDGMPSDSGSTSTISSSNGSAPPPPGKPFIVD